MSFNQMTYKIFLLRFFNVSQRPKVSPIGHICVCLQGQSATPLPRDTCFQAEKQAERRYQAVSDGAMFRKNYITTAQKGTRKVNARGRYRGDCGGWGEALKKPALSVPES